LKVIATASAIASEAANRAAMRTPAERGGEAFGALAVLKRAGERGSALPREPTTAVRRASRAVGRADPAGAAPAAADILRDVA